MLVKTCGIQTEEAAKTAIDNDTTFVGIIQVPNRKRTLHDTTIINAIHKDIVSKRKSKPNTNNFNWKGFIEENLKINFHGHNTQKIIYNEKYLQISHQLEQQGPFLVGVFRNQSIEEIEKILQLDKTSCDNDDDRLIDIVQLHGSENKQEYVNYFARKWNIPVITRYQVDDLSKKSGSILQQFTEYLPLFILLDSDAGGDGKTLNWNLLNELNVSNENIPLMLAGGMSCENVNLAKNTIKNLIGVDVSSGIESNGIKDLEKIKLFIESAK